MAREHLDESGDRRLVDPELRGQLAERGLVLAGEDLEHAQGTVDGLDRTIRSLCVDAHAPDPKPGTPSSVAICRCAMRNPLRRAQPTVRKGVM
ncbi:hypothetical protein GCM10023169_41610 [Georgenia halophila]|uniref:Uncharacterized protein n=1 Tax=Georgenia halophila TaxID=620889 RepID=A0ABP8LS61_9MICO